MLPRTVDIDGPVHFLDFEGPSDGPTFVCIHALEGHHANWLGIAPLLAERGRVLVPDLIGFGLTPLRGRKASLEANQIFLERFLRATDAGPVVLVGNSMGAAVSLLHARARPDAVRALVLIGPAIGRSFRHGVDPVVLPVFASSLAPNAVGGWLAKRLRPRGPEWFVRQMVLLCTHDPDRIDPEVLSANVAVAAERMRMPWASVAFNQASRSTIRFLGSQRRFWRMMDEVRIPTLMIAGRQDRLVPFGVVADAARARPDWDMEVIEGAGHMPQLEDPETTASVIRHWLARRLPPAA